MRKNSMIILGCVLVLAIGTTAWAELSPDEIAQLGTTLTPLGGLKAGNEDGTIPAWEGGLATPPAGWEQGTHFIDPYADDEILFTITAANMDQYADKLTVGQKALLETYPDTYKMNVYPTRRSAAYPQRIYDATKHIAATARLTEGGNGVTGAINGIPFPIPKSGHEVIWNHLLRYRADSAARTIGQAAPTRGGSYTLVKFHDEFFMQYSMPDMSEDQLNNRILFFKQEVIAPARLAGGILLGQGAPQRVALQPGPAAGPSCAQRGLRQSGHGRRRDAHLGPVRHVQRCPRPLRLEAGRPAGDLHPL
jgi:hypothetical protein